MRRWTKSRACADRQPFHGWGTSPNTIALLREFGFRYDRKGYLPGGQSPHTVLQTWIDACDYLYDTIGEGIFTSTMHPQVTGRGARMQLLEGLIRHIADKPGVTFGTCSDDVETWRVGKTPALPRDAAA